MQEQAEQYCEYINRLEEAIYWHQEWFSRVARSLIYNDKAPEDILKADAHLNCNFGRWFNNVEAPPKREQMVEELRSLHKQMHAEARLALMSVREGSFDASQYDDLEETRSLFFSAMHGLFRSVMEDFLRLQGSEPCPPIEF